MAIDTQHNSDAYVGPSPSGYPITFPYLEPGHLRVALNGALLSPDRYRVADGVLFLTPPEVAPEDTLTISRHLPYLQPVTLAEGGALPSATMERALDRLTMLAQQASLAAASGSPASPGSSNRAFLNAAARTAATPSFPGQLAVQLDNNTLWRGSDTVPGAWIPIPTPAVLPAQRLTLTLASDVGDPGPHQDAMASLIANIDPDCHLDCGDITYNGTVADWAWASDLIDADKFLTVPGNHSLDTPALQALHTSAFPLGWWERTLGGGLVTIFGINTGIKSDGSTVDGLPAIGGLQHAWLDAALKASTSRWKIVMLHHPPATTSTDAGDAPEIITAWLPVLHQADAIFCGHAHIAEWLTLHGLPILTIASAVRVNAASATRPSHPAAYPVWIEDDARILARLSVTDRSIYVDLIDIATGQLRLSRELTDKRPSDWHASRHIPLANGRHSIAATAGPAKLNSIALSGGDVGFAGVTMQFFKNQDALSAILPFSPGRLTLSDNGDPEAPTWLTPGDIISVQIAGLASYVPGTGAFFDIFGHRFF
jgi:3',5'-cyclic AMP phosphodiesterase CpdA